MIGVSEAVQSPELKQENHWEGFLISNIRALQEQLCCRYTLRPSVKKIVHFLRKKWA